MKRLSMITVLLALSLTAIVAVPVQGAQGETVTGRVSAPDVGTHPNFDGDMALNEDGSIDGKWQWKVFDFCSHCVKFCCNDISSLAFPDDATATFTGTFTCCDQPINMLCSEGMSCELTFIVTEGTNDGDYNPARVLSYLPIDVELPPGFDYGMGRGTMLVYNADGVLIANHEGNYLVETHDR